MKMKGRGGGMYSRIQNSEILLLDLRIWSWRIIIVTFYEWLGEMEK